MTAREKLEQQVIALRGAYRAYGVTVPSDQETAAELANYSDEDLTIWISEMTSELAAQ